MAIFFRSKILLLKTETTPGTDAAPNGAANAFLAQDVVISVMEGQDVDRTLDLPYFGNTGTIPADLHSKISFKVELEPSGTAGTVPAWGPALRACGMAQTVVASTSVTYNPITDNPESATIHFWLGGTRYAMLMSRGNAKLMYGKQGIPYIEFSFTGLFAVPTEVARPTPVTLTGFKAPKIAAKRHVPTFTLNAISTLKLSTFALDLGKVVEPRLLINTEEILITAGNDKVDLTIEAEAVTLLNPYQLALDQTPMAMQFIHGTVAGKRTTINVPALQLARPGNPADSQGVVEWPLNGKPLPNTGNDQFTIVLT
jgi:hypothetical protein